MVWDTKMMVWHEDTGDMYGMGFGALCNDLHKCPFCMVCCNPLVLGIAKTMYMGRDGGN